MQSLSNETNNIQIIGEFRGDENRIYFHFTNDMAEEHHIYTIFINENEITKDKIYLEVDNTHPDNYELNTQHYINVDDFDNNGLIDIKVVNITSPIIVTNFDEELDGEYKFIDTYHYKHDDLHTLIKYDDTVKTHWTFMYNGIEHKYISLSGDHTLSPIHHEFTSINGKEQIKTISVSSTSLNINYSTEYNDYVNS